MATPEQERSRTPGEVVEHPEQVEIPRHVEQGTGAQATPHQPQQLQDDQGQVVATPHPAPADPSAIKLPADQNQAQAWLGVSDKKSSRWLGEFILRQIKKAIAFGRKVVIIAKR